MISIRKSSDRGHLNHGWLDTYHTFSFGDYYDPNFMGFHSLRVINEDKVAGGQGFPPHSHRDMEIITYILSGAIEHEDSMGNKEILRAGEIQRMSAGTGVTHSEYNPHPVEELHLLQIWIIPEKRGIKPGYEQVKLEGFRLENKAALIVTSRPNNSQLKIHQDANIYASRLNKGFTLKHNIPSGKAVWIQVAKGTLSFGNQTVYGGDGIAIEQESKFELTAKDNSEALIFELN